MPAKATAKKNKTAKLADTPHSVEEPLTDTPHPQILPKSSDAPSLHPEPAEDLEDMLEDDAEDSSLEKKNTVLYWMGMILTIGIILLTGVVFTIYITIPKVVKQDGEKTSAEAPHVTPTPIQFRASDITIDVLNGSGIAGAAAKGAAKLTEKGYTVIATGNAKKQGTTQLFIAPTVPSSAIASIQADMLSLFGVSSSSGDLIGSTASARIIIGSK